MRRLFAAICVLVTVRAGADTLSDVRNAVGQLSAKQPIRATFATDQLVKSAGKFANENTSRSVTAEVAHDAAGVSITIPQTLLDKVSRAANATKASESPQQHLIGAIRTIDVVEALDYRDSLLLLLRNATVTQEKRVVFRGQPARLLTLKLNTEAEKEPGSIRIGSSKTDDQMTLWVADDNLPVAADRVIKTAGGFLFIKGTFTGHSNYTFHHVADRLLLARLETNDSGSGMGQNVEKTAVQTLTVH